MNRPEPLPDFDSFKIITLEQYCELLNFLIRESILGIADSGSIPYWCIEHKVKLPVALMLAACDFLAANEARINADSGAFPAACLN